jgi:hypothetical protein
MEVDGETCDHDKCGCGGCNTCGTCSCPSE